MILLSKTPQVLYFVQGQTAPKITGKYDGKICSDDPITDITGYTFELRLELPDDTTKSITGSVLDGPNGIFEIPLADVWDSNTWANGLSWGQIRVTIPSTGGLEIYPNYYFQVVRGI